MPATELEHQQNIVEANEWFENFCGKIRLITGEKYKALLPLEFFKHIPDSHENYDDSKKIIAYLNNIDHYHHIDLAKLRSSLIKNFKEQFDASLENLKKIFINDPSHYEEAYKQMVTLYAKFNNDLNNLDIETPIKAFISELLVNLDHNNAKAKMQSAVSERADTPVPERADTPVPSSSDAEEVSLFCRGNSPNFWNQRTTLLPDSKTPEPNNVTRPSTPADRIPNYPELSSDYSDDYEF